MQKIAKHHYRREAMLHVNRCPCIILIYGPGSVLVPEEAPKDVSLKQPTPPPPPTALPPAAPLLEP